MSKESKTVQEAIDSLASAIIFSAKHLGKEDCSDAQGCLEYLSVQIRDGSERIAEGLESIADAINNFTLKTTEK